MPRVHASVGGRSTNARQIDRPDSVHSGRLRKPGRAIIPLGMWLPTCSSHLPAYSGEATPSGRSRTYAYLVLLRMEVAAFHPASPQLLRVRNTEWPCQCGSCDPPAMQSRLCGPIPRLRQRACAHPARRAVVSRHPALWSPDLPRNACAPRDCLIYLAGRTITEGVPRRDGWALMAGRYRPDGGGDPAGKLRCPDKRRGRCCPPTTPASPAPARAPGRAA